MRVNEIKRVRVIEEVVGREYIAEDGEKFEYEEDCQRHEEAVYYSKLKKLNTKEISLYDIIDEGSQDDEVEIFDIQTDEDLENLRKYLALKARHHGANEGNIKECFSSKNGNRSDYVIDNVTKGHEVIICWNYEKDWFWTHADGSIEGYLNFLLNRMLKAIKPAK